MSVQTKRRTSYKRAIRRKGFFELKHRRLSRMINNLLKCKDCTALYLRGFHCKCTFAKKETAKAS